MPNLIFLHFSTCSKFHDKSGRPVFKPAFISSTPQSLGQVGSHAPNNQPNISWCRIGLKTPPKIFVTEPWCHKGNFTLTRKVESGCSMLPLDGWSGHHKQTLCFIMYMPKCVQVAVFCFTLRIGRASYESLWG